MNFLKALITMLTISAFSFGAAALTSASAYKINRKDKVNRDTAAGTKLYDAQQFGAKGQWSYAVSGGAANSDISLLDHEGLPVTLPANAIITNCLIDVATQPTSSTNSGSLAFSSSAVADLKAAAFVASYTTSARIACIPTGTTGTMIKTSSELTLKMRIGSEALTAGKVNVWVEYVLSE